MNPTHSPHLDPMPRRRFLETVALAGAASALPGRLSAGAPAAPRLTLALVGAAHIHTPGFISLIRRERPEARVKYVWDHDEPRARKRAAELDAQVADLDTIWSDAAVAGVIICSETHRHLELVQAAVRARKHLFAEKPLAGNRKDSDTMAQAIEDAGLIFTTGYFMRTAPVHLFLKEQVQKGVFGKINRIRGCNCHSGSLEGWFDTEWRWMADPAMAGVGAFGDLGTHSLDLMMWLGGDVEAVTAKTLVVTGRYGACDESGDAMLRFKNGANGLLSAGWVDIANPVSLEISGTKAHAVIVNGQLFFRCAEVEGADGRSPWTALPPEQPKPLHQFLNALAGKPDQPLVTPKEAADRVRVMEAMYQAADRDDWIKVG
ncbi:MAG TPA: Gfo/Idh/MocA family oxidoreductase [Candidatus Paceibacterota bacterium]|nr:Gfo/Idh/MocA family oxidoreductase [Verrucomicrobiota bacterium]HRZ43655.1 Gfo/Idh/MocA family oxidoreductase [Candidatus Paceibacterota bacterium]HRZ91280.1 Gfo/Idh/MocA family oxidoreductase [Candidatus Paceibacterota bacterium]